MSRELRQVTLRNCRQYLGKVDAIKAQAQAAGLVAADGDMAEEPPPPAPNLDETDSAEGSFRDEQSDDNQPVETEEDHGTLQLADTTTGSTGAHDEASTTCSDATEATPDSEAIANLVQINRVRHILGRIIASLRRGIRLQEKEDRRLVDRLWDQARELQGTAAVQPRRCKRQTGWRGHNSPLSEVMDADWLWEEEVRQAWLDSGATFRLDRFDRRVSKL